MTFVTLLKFTAQGAARANNTVTRAEAFKQSAKKLGVQVQATYWTLGKFDGVLVFDAPDDATATAAILQLAAEGNVQTQTTRAFDSAEMEAVLAKL